MLVEDPVMPDLIPAEDGIFDRHPVPAWIPAFEPAKHAFAGMTTLMYLGAGVIIQHPETSIQYHVITCDTLY